MTSPTVIGAYGCPMSGRRIPKRTIPDGQLISLPAGQELPERLADIGFVPVTHRQVATVVRFDSPIEVDHMEEQTRHAMRVAARI